MQVRLQSLAVYLDYKLDESYTPNKVSVSAGTSYDDLRPIKTVEMEEPTGWVNIPLQVPEVRWVHCSISCLMRCLSIMPEHL